MIALLPPLLLYSICKEYVNVIDSVEGEGTVSHSEWER